MAQRYFIDDDIRIMVDHVFLSHFCRYRWVATLIEESRKGWILDAGCGSGYGAFMISLSSYHPDVDGIDNSAKCIEWARATYERRSSLITYTQADLALLPALDETYDAVVCFEVLEHTEDPVAVLKELERVLQSGGDGDFFCSIPINHPDTRYHKRSYSVTEARKVINSVSWQYPVRWFVQAGDDPRVVPETMVADAYGIKHLIAWCRRWR